MSYQLPLFPLDEPPNHDPIQLLRDGAALVLSVSGGKDSDAMCHHLLERRQAEGWSGDVKMVHADLGRAEWHNTSDYIHGLAQRKAIPLHIVRWTHGDLYALECLWERLDLRCELKQLLKKMTSMPRMKEPSSSW